MTPRPFLLLPLFFHAILAALECPKEPSVLNMWYGQDSVSLPSNFECKFTYLINDPKTFALVTIAASGFSADEVVQIQGDFDTVGNEKGPSFSLTACFPPSQVTIYVKTGEHSSAQIKYSLYKKDMVFNDMNPTEGIRSVGTTLSPQYLQLNQYTDFGSNWVAIAESTVSLISTAAPQNDPIQLLNYFFFEGSGDDKVMKGSLYSIYNKIYHASNKRITIYAATLSYNPDFMAAVILNDKLNLEDCSTYATQWSYGYPSQTIATPMGPISVDTTLDASAGTACLTIVNEFDPNTGSSHAPYFLNALITEGNADLPTPIVVAGAPMKNNSVFGTVIGNLGNPTTFDLPQFFDGYARTIILNKGRLQMGTTTDPTKVSILATPGRKGFLMTQGYPFMSNYPSTSQSLCLQSADKKNFTIALTITYSYCAGTENVVVKGDNQFQQKISLVDKTNIGKTFYFTSTQLFMFIAPDNTFASSRGAFVEYAVVETDPSTPETGTTTIVTSTVITTTSTIPPTTSISLGISGVLSVVILLISDLV